MLLKVKQRRDLGVEQRNVTETETTEMLNCRGVSYVIGEPNFWDDLKNKQRLQRVHTTIPIVCSEQIRLRPMADSTSFKPSATEDSEAYRAGTRRPI